MTHVNPNINLNKTIHPWLMSSLTVLLRFVLSLTWVMGGSFCWGWYWAWHESWVDRFNKTIHPWLMSSLIPTSTKRSTHDSCQVQYQPQQNDPPMTIGLDMSHGWIVLLRLVLSLTWVMGGSFCWGWYWAWHESWVDRLIHVKLNINLNKTIHPWFMSSSISTSTKWSTHDSCQA
jgi:hypothetical protein